MNIPNLSCHSLNLRYPGAEAPAAPVSWYLTVLASLPVCAAVGNMYLLKPEHVQNVMFSDEFSSAYCSWIVGSKVENAGATAATTGGGSISLAGNRFVVIGGNFSAEGCEEKSLHPVANLLSIVWDQTVIPDDHTSAPARPAVHLYLQEERPAHTPDLHPLNTCSCQSDQRTGECVNLRPGCS